MFCNDPDCYKAIDYIKLNLLTSDSKSNQVELIYLTLMKIGPQNQWIEQITSFEIKNDLEKNITVILCFIFELKFKIIENYLFLFCFINIL